MKHKDIKIIRDKPLSSADRKRNDTHTELFFIGLIIGIALGSMVIWTFAVIQRTGHDALFHGQKIEVKTPRFIDP